MNGIENITRRIDEETQSEIDRILEAARAEAAEITARYQSQAEAERTAQAERNKKAAAEREERLAGMANLEARKVSLAAKQELVERAYDLALQKLCALPADQYTQTVAALLAQAAADGRGEVIFAPETRKQLGAEAVALANEKLGGGKLTLSGETRPILGGFILKRGNVEVNGTFETLVRLQRAETSGAVAKRLFPEA
ncbi:V-type ATP synthase subunit E [Oscillibacter sp.]|uniref:V-type ATP synthase subunit E n=1 Tax=Oscillibacter sp. TaxID=1945593 RepID=UPI00262240A1|nr:V-type ATP synthase subunit E family protein [Oscillibacter sp.]MDD3347529.1 V-type ATP synthase subunit E family protein [Oscillibacter sp.]